MSDISNEFNAGEIYQNNDHIRRRLINEDREKKIHEMLPWETYDSIKEVAVYSKIQTKEKYIYYSSIQ